MLFRYFSPLPLLLLRRRRCHCHTLSVFAAIIALMIFHAIAIIDAMLLLLMLRRCHYRHYFRFAAATRSSRRMPAASPRSAWRADVTLIFADDAIFHYYAFRC